MTKKTKQILLASLLMILIAVLIALFVIQPTGKVIEQKTIKIGVIAPLTGTGAYIGQDITEGINLAVEEINSKGGINRKLIEIKYEDDRYDPKQTVTAYQNLITTFNPDIIISAGITEAIIPLAEKDKMPLLATVNSQSKLASMGDYTFRFFTNADLDAPTIANYATKELGLKKIAILNVNNGFGNSYRDVFSEIAEANGAKIIGAETMTYADWDYSTQLTKIKATNPEAVYIISIENQIFSAIDQMKKLDMLKNIKVLAAGTAAVPNGIKKAEELNIDIYTSAFCWDEFPESYVQKFMKKYNKYPGFFTVFGYDSISLIKEAEKQGSSKEDIKKGLLKIKNFPTTIGDVSSDPEGEMIFKSCPKKVSGEGIYNLETGSLFKL